VRSGGQVFRRMFENRMGRLAYPGRRCACPGLIDRRPVGATQHDWHRPLAGQFRQPAETCRHTLPTSASELPDPASRASICELPAPTCSSDAPRFSVFGLPSPVLRRPIPTPHAPCSTPHAPCSMPQAPCLSPTLYAPCSMLYARSRCSGSLGYVVGKSPPAWSVLGAQHRLGRSRGAETPGGSGCRESSDCQALAVRPAPG
jgi:hypothetical protein